MREKQRPRNREKPKKRRSGRLLFQSIASLLLVLSVLYAKEAQPAAEKFLGACLSESVDIPAIYEKVRGISKN